MCFLQCLWFDALINEFCTSSDPISVKIKLADIFMSKACSVNKNSIFFSLGIRHQSVSCDECHQSSVSGIRWKCVQCHDFDLCTGCYMEGKHNCDHAFLQYTDVQQRRYASIIMYVYNSFPTGLIFFPGSVQIFLS